MRSAADLPFREHCGRAVVSRSISALGALSSRVLFGDPIRRSSSLSRKVDVYDRVESVGRLTRGAGMRAGRLGHIGRKTT